MKCTDFYIFRNNRNNSKLFYFKCSIDRSMNDLNNDKNKMIYQTNS